MYGFSPVCVRMCAFRCELLKYIFVHELYGHRNGLGRSSSLIREGGGVMLWGEVGWVGGAVSMVATPALTLSALGVVRTGTIGI